MSNVMRDKSWMVIMALLFFVPPLGFLALIAKIIHTVYSNKNNEVSQTYTRTKDPTYTRPQGSSKENHNYRDELLDIEEDLKDAFDEWQHQSTKHKSRVDKFSSEVESAMGSKADLVELEHEDADFSEITLDQGLEVSEDQVASGQEGLVDAQELVADQDLSAEDLEDYLNVSTDTLTVKEIDLSISDVHIDTEITFDDQVKDQSHEGQEPLKVVTCTMCGHETPIYEINVFETPTCEKCGMLLLDR